MIGESTLGQGEPALDRRGASIYAAGCGGGPAYLRAVCGTGRGGDRLWEPAGA
jgi:hypothetical protein